MFWYHHFLFYHTVNNKYKANFTIFLLRLRNKRELTDKKGRDSSRKEASMEGIERKISQISDKMTQEMARQIKEIEKNIRYEMYEIEQRRELALNEIKEMLQSMQTFIYNSDKVEIPVSLQGKDEL